MSSLRPMTPQDLFNFSQCNMDPLTETYGVNFYLEYLSRWPHLCHVMVNSQGDIEGYILGKMEASPNWHQPTTQPYDPRTNKNMNYLPWHAHITALTVAPRARRNGHARSMTEVLENIADEEKAWFVDLFVRADNINALALYKGMGYSVFRKVKCYYADGQDAYDMRKPMKRDEHKLHIRPNGEAHEVDPDDVCTEITDKEILGAWHRSNPPYKIIMQAARRNARKIFLCHQIAGKIPKSSFSASLPPSLPSHTLDYLRNFSLESNYRQCISLGSTHLGSRGSRDPPKPSQMAVPRPSVKGTDDYLTARGANPSTGLITPFTPSEPDIKHPFSRSNENVRQFAHFRSDPFSKSMESVPRLRDTAATLRMRRFKQPLFDQLPDSTTDPDATSRARNIPVWQDQVEGGGEQHSKAPNMKSPSFTKVDIAPAVRRMSSLLYRRLSQQVENPDGEAAAEAGEDEEISVAEELDYPDVPASVYNGNAREENKTPPQVLIHRRAVAKLQAHVREPQSLSGRPQPADTTDDTMLTVGRQPPFSISIQQHIHKAGQHSTARSTSPAPIRAQHPHYIPTLVIMDQETSPAPPTHHQPPRGPTTNKQQQQQQQNREQDAKISRKPVGSSPSALAGRGRIRNQNVSAQRAATVETHPHQPAVAGATEKQKSRHTPQCKEPEPRRTAAAAAVAKQAIVQPPNSTVPLKVRLTPPLRPADTPYQRLEPLPKTPNTAQKLSLAKGPIIASDPRLYNSKSSKPKELPPLRTLLQPLRIPPKPPVETPAPPPLPPPPLLDPWTLATALGALCVSALTFLLKHMKAALRSSPHTAPFAALFDSGVPLDRRRVLFLDLLKRAVHALALAYLVWCVVQVVGLCGRIVWVLALPVRLVLDLLSWGF